MKTMDRFVAWNARQAGRLTIPILLLKAFAGFLLAGILMAVLVPFLHNRDVVLRPWMIWTVISLMIAVCAGPDLYQRYRRKQV